MQFESALKRMQTKLPAAASKLFHTTGLDTNAKFRPCIWNRIVGTGHLSVR